MVTGATGGIGRWIARGLAVAGHDLILVARDERRGQDAATWIRTQAPAAGIDIVQGDLSLLGDTRRVAETILARRAAIDVLVNNAGIFRARRETTAEGMESVLAVNHLSPFLLTKLLQPALSSAANGARVVNVGSSTADRATIDPSDLQGERRWGMVRSYSQSKLALTICTLEWARRLQGTGIVANVVHPGAVATGLIRARGPIALAWRLMAPFLLTEEAGADTPLTVATAPEFATLTGAYVKKRQAVRLNPRALDAALSARVWQSTETLLRGR